MKVIHLKSKKIYEVLGEVINCTNENDGQVMVHYTNGNKNFVREKTEFSEKFKVIGTELLDKCVGKSGY